MTRRGDTCTCVMRRGRRGGRGGGGAGAELGEARDDF